MSVPFAVAALTVALKSGSGQRQLARWIGGAPVAVFPTEINLGAQESGCTAVASLSLANAGGQELRLDEIRTDCACSGLELERDGRFVRFKALQITPGEEVPLRIELQVRGAPGGAAHHMISFRTNDPSQPEGVIRVVVPKIRGGFLARPASVAFGSVPAHAQVRCVVELYDGESPPRAVGAISCSRPDDVRVHLLPPSPLEGQKKDEENRALVARLELVPICARIGSFDGELSVSVATDSLHRTVIPILGRVMPEIEVTPSSLVLPRRSGAGPIYFGNCLCRSTTGQPLTLTVDVAPAGIGVKLTRANSNPTQVLVRVEWWPGQEEKLAPETARYVRLRHKAGYQETTVEIPVYLTPSQKARSRSQ